MHRSSGSGALERYLWVAWVAWVTSPESVDVVVGRLGEVVPLIQHLHQYIAASMHGLHESHVSLVLFATSEAISVVL